MAQQMTLGEMLHRLREERELTTRALAEKTGYSPAYHSMLEKGRRRPDAFALGRILAKLNAGPAAEKRAMQKLARSQNGGSALLELVRRATQEMLEEEEHGIRRAGQSEPTSETASKASEVIGMPEEDLADMLRLLRHDQGFRRFVLALVRMSALKRRRYLEVIEKLGALAVNLPARTEPEETS